MNAIQEIESQESQCPLCAGKALQLIYEREVIDKSWSLRRCGNCGLHFTTPTPSDADITRLYSGNFHVELRADGQTELIFGEKFRRYIAVLRKHLPAGRVVDVGCATGLLVRMLKDLGYDAEGIELHPLSAAWGREHYKVEIKTTPLEQQPYAPNTLQAMIMTDVLEHTQNPLNFLKIAGEMLVDDGLLFISFPDITSLEARYTHLLTRATKGRENWRNCHIPLHVWEFTRRTAELLFDRAGFTVLSFSRSQIRPATAFSIRRKLARLPILPLCWPPFERLFGTQMEFLIRKKPRP